MKTYNFISEIKIDGLTKASASFENPITSKLKFVFTDDQPNGNGKGIPQSAFAGLIKSGVFMPLKMAQGGIAPDHSGAVPLGVISDLSEVPSDGKNPAQLVGEAVLWSEERPEDVNFIKSSYASGNKLNISWEVLYSDSSTDDNGIEWYQDPIVQGATLVGIPAYEGRTPVLSVASLDEAAVWTRAYIDNLPDSAFLYIEPGGTKEEGKTVPRSLRHFPYKDANGKIDLPHLRNALARIPQSNVPQEAKDKAIKKAQRLLAGQKAEGSSMDENLNQEALEEQIETLKTTVSTLQGKLTEYETELASLREYKDTVEREKAEAALLKARLEAFASSGIVPTAEEIEAKKAYWLKLDEETFNFLVSELSSKKETPKTDSASLEVPDTLSKTDSKDPLEIVRKGLKEKRG